MYVTTNSAHIWKRVADENQQSARLLARVSIGLLVLVVLIGGFAYSEHRRNGELCATIRSGAISSSVPSVQTFGGGLVEAYCN